MFSFSYIHFVNKESKNEGQREKMFELRAMFAKATCVALRKCTKQHSKTFILKFNPQSILRTQHWMQHCFFYALQLRYNLLHRKAMPKWEWLAHWDAQLPRSVAGFYGTPLFNPLFNALRFKHFFIDLHIWSVLYQ